MLYKAKQIPSLMDVDVVILRSAKLWAYESEGKIRCDTCRIHNICSLSRLFSSETHVKRKTGCVGNLPDAGNKTAAPGFLYTRPLPPAPSHPPLPSRALK